MLKPGPDGWDLYGKLVAEAYERAPLFDDEAAYSFKALEPFIDTMFGQISRSRVNIEFVDENPYPSEKEMCLDAMQNGVLKIWKGGTEHPIFDPVLNTKLRAVHDYMAHCQGKTGFGQQGEIAAFNKHMKTVPEAGREALFTEVVGQASYFLNYGQFPEQKIAILKGFDKHEVGEVDPEITGYRLDREEKRLVKVVKV
mgnify:FL=1